MRIFKHPILFGGLKHLRQVFWLSIMNILPVPGTLRWIFAKWGGVNFISDNEKKWFYIGSNVRFDRVYPGNIIIHNGVHITHGVIVLTHCLDTQNSDLSDIFWKENHITIMPRAFIGTNTIVCADVTIGEGAVVGAGSIVTKDIPPYEIWAGNPARFIKKRS